MTVLAELLLVQRSALDNFFSGKLQCNVPRLCNQDFPKLAFEMMLTESVCSLTPSDLHTCADTGGDELLLSDESDISSTVEC